jgi:hypothetical protein
LRDPDAREFHIGRAIRVRRDQSGRQARRAERMTMAETQELN